MYRLACRDRIKGFAIALANPGGISDGTKVEGFCRHFRRRCLLLSSSVRHRILRRTEVATFSGVQLAFGTKVNQPQMFGQAQQKNVDAEPLATLAGLCALLGLGLGFIESSRAALGPAVSGVVGALFLLLVKSNMDDKIVKQGQGMLQVSYEAGFTPALLLLIAGAALNGYVFFSQRARRAVASLPDACTTTGRSASPTVSAPPASPGVCPHCGASTGAKSKFCAVLWQAAFSKRGCRPRAVLAKEGPCSVLNVVTRSKLERLPELRGADRRRAALHLPRSARRSRFGLRTHSRPSR